MEILLQQAIQQILDNLKILEKNQNILVEEIIKLKDRVDTLEEKEKYKLH
jgi:hypothetical protein